MAHEGVSFFKKACHEYPHFVLCGGILAFALVGGLFVTNNHIKHDLDRRLWKKRYTVVREEDFDPNVQVYRPDQIFPLLNFKFFDKSK